MIVAGSMGAAVAVVLGGSTLVAALTGGTPQAAGRTAPPTPTATVAGPILDCSASNLDLSVEIPSSRFTLGEPVPVTVTVSHHGRSCLVDGSDAGRQVVVSSGSDRIWSSADCPSEDRPLLLSGDDVDQSVVTWDGVRSAEGCPQGLAGVAPGTYAVAVMVPGADGATSEPVTFTVVAPADPKPPANPEPPVDPNAVDPNAGPPAEPAPPTDPADPNAVDPNAVPPADGVPPAEPAPPTDPADPNAVDPDVPEP